MAGTDIKLTPEELIAQSTELTSLQTEFESVFSQLTSTLNSMNDSWSATLAGNFAGKIQAAQKSFTSVANMLQTAPLQHGFPRVRLHHRVRCWRCSQVLILPDWIRFPIWQAGSAKTAISSGRLAIS